MTLGYASTHPHRERSNAAEVLECVKKATTHSTFLRLDTKGVNHTLHRSLTLGRKQISKTCHWRNALLEGEEEVKEAKADFGGYVCGRQPSQL